MSNTIIFVDLNDLIEYSVEPQQYVFMYLYHTEGHMRAYTVSPVQIKDLEYLERNNFIKITGAGIEPSISLLDNAYELLKLKKDDELEEMFIEFYEAFPNSVPDGRGGRRVLKAKSHESRDFEVARRKYMTLVKKNPVIHRSIMKGLAKQKEQVSKLQFMNAIETWINQRVWERYVDEEDIIDYARDV
jgi:hypothetical protein